jgi:hypothetical protein
VAVALLGRMPEPDPDIFLAELAKRDIEVKRVEEII